MPTLPELFERLGEHGEHAGADVVVARAVAAAAAPVPLAPPGVRTPPRRRSRFLLAAAVTVVVLLVPVAVLSNRGSQPPGRQHATGPAYPPPAAARAATLARLHWSEIAVPPIQIEPTNQVITWAGDELIVFGEDGRHEGAKGVGAAYSPGTNRWHLLPRAPLNAAWFFPPSFVWTGTELIVFPDTVGGTEAARAEAYSPRANSWRVLPSAPLCSMPEAGAVWTGTEVVVGGGYSVSGSQCPADRTLATATYDPATNRWSRGPALPVPELNRIKGTKLVWARDRVVAVVASQWANAGPRLTNENTPSTTVGTKGPLTRSRPVVRTYSWVPGSVNWEPLANGAIDTFGQLPNATWTPFARGSRVVFPPSMPFCGEGELEPCSLMGIEAGTVYDTVTHRRIALATPDMSQTAFDTLVSTGGALVGTVGDFNAGTKQAYAWDLTTGRRITLAAPPAVVQAAVWTGHELIAFAIPAPGPGVTILKLSR